MRQYFCSLVLRENSREPLNVCDFGGGINTRARVKFVIGEEWSHASGCIDMVVCGEFCFRQVVDSVVLSVSYIGTKVILHHLVRVFGLSISLGARLETM